MFAFQTVLTGPLFFYTDYMQFITGESNGKGRTSSWRTGFSKLLISLGFFFMIFLFSLSTHPEIIAQPDYLQLPWWRWWLMFWFVIFMQRCLYYYAWILADGVCNISGFGFNGLDKNGYERWDLVSNVDAWKVEVILASQ